MKSNIRSAAAVRYCAWFLLSCAIAALPSNVADAQTNAAAMSVRNRVEGLGGGPQSPPATDPRASQRAAPANPSGGDQPDLSYVPADAVAIAVLRPAKCLASPLAKLLPVEVASAYGMKYTGFDPAKVNEVLAFVQLSNEGPGVGVVAKFNEPYKGSAIPASLRGGAKLGKLGERNYLQAQAPGQFSFYGPDNRTLIVAPDAPLRHAVASKDQPKSGPLVERVLAAPPGSDIFVVVDVAGLRPMIEPMIAMAQMQAQQMPPEAQQMFEIPSLVTFVEFTANLAVDNPTSLVIHANDDASAEKLESLIQSASQLQQTMMKAQTAQAATGDDPIAAAMAQFSERTSGQWAPKREGSKLTFFQYDGPDARERQLVLAAMLGFAAGKMSSAYGSPEEPPQDFAGPFGGEGPFEAPPERPEQGTDRR